MSTFRKTIIKKPRKLHECLHCGSRIDGQHYYFVGIYDFEFRYGRFCFDCFEPSEEELRRINNN